MSLSMSYEHFNYENITRTTYEYHKLSLSIFIHFHLFLPLTVKPLLKRTEGQRLIVIVIMEQILCLISLSPTGQTLHR